MKPDATGRIALLLCPVLLLALQDRLPWNVPVLPVLYGLVTLESVRLGLGWLRSGGHAPLWDRRCVPGDVQIRFSRLLGALFLLNAAICPVGLLAGRSVGFDTDFVLLAQFIGVPLICLLGLLPPLWAGHTIQN